MLVHSARSFSLAEIRDYSPSNAQGPVVRKPINLIQDERLTFVPYFQLTGETFFCLFLFFKVDFF